jgi:tetratricopeptide (TPR) repeat protein
LTHIELTDDPVVQAGLHARLGRALWVAGDADLAQETLERGAARLPPDAPAADRARVLGALGHVLMLRMRNERAEPMLREALAYAEQAGAPLERARINISLGIAATETIDHAEADRLFLDGRRIADEIGALDEVLRSYVNRRDEAGAVLVEAEPGVSDGMPGGALLQAGAELSALRGDAAGATRRADRASRLLAGAVGPMWAAPLAVTLATVALWDGRPDEAAETVGGALAALGDETDPAAVPYLAPLMAIGAHAEADVAERARSLGERADERSARERLHALVARLATFAGERSPEVRAFAAMGAAETQRESAEAWAAVAADWTALPRPFHAAYARWREGAAALDAGEGRSRAAPPLRAAAATARSLGAAPLLAEVTALAPGAGRAGARDRDGRGGAGDPRRPCGSHAARARGPMPGG